MNKCVLIGRLTKDPELRFSGNSENSSTRFTVAVQRQYKRDEADFINCVAFNKTAETISKYFTKGKPIAITGHIQTGSYDAQDGTKRYTTDVIVESFEFVSGSNDNNSNDDNSSRNNNYNESFGEGSFNDDITPMDDGDMPF